MIIWHHLEIDLDLSGKPLQTDLRKKMGPDFSQARSQLHRAAWNLGGTRRPWSSSCFAFHFSPSATQAKIYETLSNSTWVTSCQYFIDRCLFASYMYVLYIYICILHPILPWKMRNNPLFIHYYTSTTITITITINIWMNNRCLTISYLPIYG